jgi:hypothetical protein
MSGAARVGHPVNVDSMQGPMAGTSLALATAVGRAARAGAKVAWKGSGSERRRTESIVTTIGGSGRPTRRRDQGVAPSDSQKSRAGSISPIPVSL